MVPVWERIGRTTMQGTQVALESNTFFLIIEYIAILCCGMVGGLSAIRKGYDLFAILITAWLTALGGGIIRDVMLGAVPPVGISDRGFVFTALASGVLVAVIRGSGGRDPPRGRQAQMVDDRF